MKLILVAVLISMLSAGCASVPPKVQSSCPSDGQIQGLLSHIDREEHERAAFAADTVKVWKLQGESESNALLRALAKKRGGMDAADYQVSRQQVYDHLRAVEQELLKEIPRLKYARGEGM